MLTMAGTEVDRGRGLTALSAPQLGQHLQEHAIAVISDEQAHGDNRLPATAVQFQATIRPVGKALLAAEGRRMHRGMVL